MGSTDTEASIHNTWVEILYVNLSVSLEIHEVVMAEKLVWMISFFLHMGRSEAPLARDSLKEISGTVHRK